MGGSPVRLAEDADAANIGLAWLDDGTILYEQESTANSSQIVLISEDGGEPLEVALQPEELVIWATGLPGSRGAFVVGSNRNLYVVDLRDQSSELILEEVIRAWYTPTGHLVYLRSDGALFAAPFDLGALAITGSAIPLFDGVRVAPLRAAMLLGADGTLLYVEGSSTGGSGIAE